MGATNEYNVQKFTYNRQGVYKLDTLVESADTCFDGDEKCATMVQGDACTTDDSVKATCRASCGGCDKTIGLDILYVVESASKDYRAILGGLPGGELKGWTLAKEFSLKHTTWLVKDEKSGKTLYTIQRRAHKQDCKAFFFDCKAVWKIYQGKKDGKALVYYGIQHKTAFKFYRSREDFQSGNAPWIASYQKMLPTKANKDGLYQVTVKPGKDATLMLLAAFAVFKKNDLVAPTK